MNRQNDSQGAAPSPRARALTLAAEEIMRARMTEPLTAAAVARDVGVTLRRLQMAFREMGREPPRERLTNMRLDLARARLDSPGPHEGVSEIALACGFNHLGRFAAAYRARFGEAPSATLRRARRTGAGAKARTGGDGDGNGGAGGAGGAAGSGAGPADDGAKLAAPARRPAQAPGRRAAEGAFDCEGGPESGAPASARRRRRRPAPGRPSEPPARAESGAAEGSGGEQGRPEGEDAADGAAGARRLGAAR
ncbi:helix-turn-helix transcriptional regulator [Oceanicella actignis]|uniref:AraC-type DNA-binding protein n=1 Tax=Oceanicella actignis TaxID=1189325 RepID=A0A1M7S9B6_9RHOB|nr:helix-turn-helix transcriptional regulator [Oceanicella actignis]SET30294.1 AraC-type DNA-binding protein [Oceanicella actignis]SHN55259.1 AraC-type DNA-binding protein [Oceanicella actignis]